MIFDVFFFAFLNHDFVVIFSSFLFRFFRVFFSSKNDTQKRPSKIQFPAAPNASERSPRETSPAGPEHPTGTSPQHPPKTSQKPTFPTAICRRPHNGGRPHRIQFPARPVPAPGPGRTAPVSLRPVTRSADKPIPTPGRVLPAAAGRGGDAVAGRRPTGSGFDLLPFGRASRSYRTDRRATSGPQHFSSNLA